MTPDPIMRQLKYYQAQIRQDPDNGILWLEYGNFLDREFIDIDNKVIEAYQKAVQLLPKTDLRPKLGSIYVRFGDAEKGFQLIQESIAENPRVTTSYCYLADALIHEERYAEACTACEKAIECEPDFEEAHYLLGDAVRHESHEESIRHFQRAVELDPDYQLAWQALGREYLSTEDYSDSIQACKKAIELDPEDGWAMIFLANAFARTGSLDEADKWYRAAIKAFPDYDTFKKWYAEFQRQRSELEHPE